jgi:hypothetical protein
MTTDTDNMIDAEVKSIDWSDEFPDNSGGPVMLAITASIGERGKEGANNFQVIVCNPAWIATETQNKSGIWPRGMLVVNTVNPGHIQRTLQSLADQFRRSDNWNEFAERMNRYLLWEYEDVNERLKLTRFWHLKLTHL